MALSLASRAARAFAASPSLFTSSLTALQRRHLNVHEYVSMGLMKEYDVPVPRSAVATTPDEAELAYASKLGGGGACHACCCVTRRRARGCGPRGPASAPS